MENVELLPLTELTRWTWYSGMSITKNILGFNFLKSRYILRILLICWHNVVIGLYYYNDWRLTIGLSKLFSLYREGEQLKDSVQYENTLLYKWEYFKSMLPQIHWAMIPYALIKENSRNGQISKYFTKSSLPFTRYFVVLLIQHWKKK